MITRKLKRMLFWLIKPAQTPSESLSTRKARLLAWLLALLILFGFLITTAAYFFNSTQPFWHNPATWLMVVASIILGGIYRLSQTQYYPLSAGLTIAISVATIFIAAILDPGPLNYYALFYLVLPVLLASVFLSTRAAAITTGLNALGILLFPVFMPHIPLYNIIFGPFSLVIMASGAIILATHYWNLLEQDSRAELAQNEERYRAVVEQSTNCIFLTDLETKKIKESNPALQQLLGYTAAEISELTIYDFVAHEPTSIDQQFELIITHQAHTCGERQYRRKDGSLVDVETSANLITYGGREVACIVSQDITHRRQAQLAQEQYKVQLEEQVAARTAELTTLNQQLLQEFIERARTIAALQASEEQFRLSFDLAPIGVVILTPEGKFWRINQAYCDMLSYTAEELIGRSFTEITHPDDIALNLILLNQLLQGSISHFQMEKRYINKQGKILYGILHVALVRDSNRSPLHFIAQTLDITERKQAEETLRQSNEQLSRIALDNARLLAQERRQRQIAESFREVMLALNSSLDQATVLTKILEQLGQVITCDSAGIFLQKNDALLLLADTTQTSQDIGFAISLAGNDPVVRVFNHNLPLIIADVHQDAGWEIWEGGEKIRGWMGAPLLINGQPIGVLAADSFEIGTFREEDAHILQIFANQAAIAINNAHLYASAQQEIAERRQAEEALTQARDHALMSSRLKTELLAKVSHELRTPLGAIIGFAEMLEGGVYGRTSLEQKRIIAEIIDSGQYLTGLVNELLDQAHFESGRLKLQLNTFTPAALVEPVLSKMKVLAQNKDISLTGHLADNLPALLSGDLARLQQILVNLVSNAIKFTPQGTVQVHLFRPDADHWAIQVSDTGVGIPPEAQTYIFEPFRQVDGSMTRRQAGSGLGLSIVKQLTELMNGQITLESKIGQGSTFTISLPLLITQESHHELA